MIRTKAPNSRVEVEQELFYQRSLPSSSITKNAKCPHHKRNLNDVLINKKEKKYRNMLDLTYVTNFNALCFKFFSSICIQRNISQVYERVRRGFATESALEFVCSVRTREYWTELRATIAIQNEMGVRMECRFRSFCTSTCKLSKYILIYLYMYMFKVSLRVLQTGVNHRQSFHCLLLRKTLAKLEKQCTTSFWMCYEFKKHFFKRLWLQKGQPLLEFPNQSQRKIISQRSISVNDCTKVIVSKSSPIMIIEEFPLGQGENRSTSWNVLQLTMNN